MYDLGQYRSDSYETTAIRFLTTRRIQWANIHWFLIIQSRDNRNCIIGRNYKSINSTLNKEVRISEIRSQISRDGLIRNQWMLAHWIHLVVRNRMEVVSYESVRYWPRSYIFCFFNFFYIWKIMWYDVISTISTFHFDFDLQSRNISTFGFSFRLHV